MKGVVYKSTGSWYTIKAADGIFYECKIKGKFRIEGIKSTNPIAAGDHVEFEVETSAEFEDMVMNKDFRISEAIVEGLAANNLEKEDIDMLIPHQANLRIAQFIQRKFRLSDDKVFNNIMKYGNTTAASVIIALTEAWELGKIKDNDLVVLAAFGSGFTWGSVIMRW